MVHIGRWAIYLLPIAILITLAVVFFIQLQPGNRPDEIPSALIGRAVPDFDLPRLRDAMSVHAKDFPSGPYAINFFASWCIPCEAEHPYIRQIHDLGLPVYGINFRDQKEAAEAWLHRLGNPFAEVLVDAKGRTAIDFGVTGIPETFFVDAAGIIRWRMSGPIEAGVWKRDLAPLITRLKAEAAQ